MTDPVHVREVPGGYLVEAHFEPDGSPCCGPFHTDREQAEAEARRKLPLVRWYRERNERSGVAVGFWAAPFAAWRNLPSGVDLLPEHHGNLRGDLSIAAVLGIGGGLVDQLDYDPQPLDLEADDGDVVSSAAEAPSGHPVGLGGPAAAAEDGEDGHGGSVPPVDADGTWAEGLLGAAVRVGSGGCCMQDHIPTTPLCPWTTMDECHGAGLHVPCADVFTRDRVRVRVVLREPVERGDYVWRENVAGFVSAREEREG